MSIVFLQKCSCLKKGVMLSSKIASFMKKMSMFLDIQPKRTIILAHYAEACIMLTEPNNED